MRRAAYILLVAVIPFLFFGQGAKFYRTIQEKHLHYLEFRAQMVIVYKMGQYYNKMAPAPAIVLQDTLVKEPGSDSYKGRIYTLEIPGKVYTLRESKKDKYELQVEPDSGKVNAQLNKAYHLKSFFELSRRIDAEFPLGNYDHWTGYREWNRVSEKASDHDKFIELTKQKIKLIYDSVHQKQSKSSNTTNYILANAKQVDYSLLKDSLKTLPIDYRPRSAYFDTCVYRLCKSNPETFYKILQDFPSERQFVYYAVEEDKALVNEIKKVSGHDQLKREFIREKNSGKAIIYRTIAVYAVMGGLIAWLIIAQP
ncbi:MAG: hypothetical protein JNL60_12330 [Bacteroidia bacterium]|nr:hypothetical protein [Bacteroidia bacterium]